MKTWALVLSLGLVYFASAEIPPLVVPEGVGVNIHFVTGHERDLDMIAAAGFKFVRMDFGWGGIERTKGEYDWSGYDELTANLEKRGIRALYILDYSNWLYEEEVTSKNPISGQQHKTIASPQHPESVAAFARWAGAAAKRYAGRKIIWEIWNEPNSTSGSPSRTCSNTRRWPWQRARPFAKPTRRPPSSVRPHPASRGNFWKLFSSPAFWSTSTP